MEKRTILAIMISIVILVTWQYFFMDPVPPEPTEALQVDTSVETIEKTLPVIDIPTPKPAQSDQEKGEQIVIETPLLRLTFDTKGAQLTSVKLRQFRQTLEEDSDPVELIKNPMPNLTMKNGFNDRSLVFNASKTGNIDLYDDPLDLIFSTEVSEGIIIRKIFTIDPREYLIGYKTVIDNSSNDAVSLNLDLIINGTYPIDADNRRYVFEGPVLLNEKHLEEFSISKVKKTGTYREFPGEIKWFGYEDQYFLKTIIPTSTPATNLTIKRMNSDTLQMSYEIPAMNIEPSSSLASEYLIFIGPKEIKTLKASGFGLEKALDFGFFDIIAKPLLISMNWINTYLHSYGWSIILLTIIIKIILYPLTLKSFTSMKELQKVQPLMKEIQQQYKEDKQKMNQEMMKLYSEHKINPLGGCLPMLLQIPILFALYKVFYSAIELRHTPFYICGSWLPDLSAKDPYYITPILMGLSQLVMQKMTPTTGDPTQQKIMLFMPVVFTFIFLNFPSGLVIYWLISNTLSIAQQAYINRKHT